MTLADDVSMDLGEGVNFNTCQGRIQNLFWQIAHLPCSLWFKPKMFRFWTKACKSPKHNWPLTVESINHANHFQWAAQLLCKDSALIMFISTILTVQVRS